MESDWSSMELSDVLIDKTGKKKQQNPKTVRKVQKKVWRKCKHLLPRFLLPA